VWWIDEEWDDWSRVERIIAGTEAGPDGVDTRFVVANLLFAWRRRFAAGDIGEPAIMPVTITSPAMALLSAPETIGRMEITLSTGETIVVGADVDASALTRVVEALRR